MLPTLDSTEAVVALVRTMLAGYDAALTNTQWTLLRQLFDAEFSTTTTALRKATTFMRAGAHRMTAFTRTNERRRAAFIAAVCAALVLVRWQQQPPRADDAPTNDVYTLVAFTPRRRAGKLLLDQVVTYMRRLDVAHTDPALQPVVCNVETFATRQFKVSSYPSTMSVLRGVTGDSLVVNGALDARFLYDAVVPSMEMRDAKTLFIDGDGDDDDARHGAAIFDDLANALTGAGTGTLIAVANE
jgi:hypothetical protein